MQKHQQEWKRQQETIIAKLESFRPRVSYRGNNVWSLRFSGDLTDDGLRHVKELAGLELLDLQNQTHVSDAGLEHLKGLVGLLSLDLSGTHVTDEGVKKLQEALPNCEIRR